MKTILSIAGSDSFGGAGIQADIKTAHAHGVYATTVVTAVTAQNSLGVSSAKVFDAGFIKEQFLQVTNDLEVDAIKIGMLANCEIIECVGELIDHLKCPIVLDPVAISRAGSALLDSDAIEALKSLFPKASVITPNRFEAKLFFDIDSFDEESLKKVQSKPYRTLIKNISPDGDESIDVLTTQTLIQYFPSIMGNKDNTHGTGCSYSTAIACALAKGDDLERAITKSKRYILKAIQSSPNFGAGNGPINHMLRII